MIVLLPYQDNATTIFDDILDTVIGTADDRLAVMRALHGLLTEELARWGVPYKELVRDCGRHASAAKREAKRLKGEAEARDCVADYLSGLGRFAIADKRGLNYQTVRKRIISVDPAILRTWKRCNVDVDLMLEDYRDAGMSLAQVAAKHGCSVTTAFNRMQRRDPLAMRRAGDSRQRAAE
jgi:hypothetical protein